MKIIQCTLEHLPILANMNQHLYEDENNDNIPSLDILEERLKISMENGSKAYLFKSDNETVGYALVKMNVNPYYLSHFFICRDMRRNHYGTAAFHTLMEELNCETIDLDVFCWNERGQCFWKSLGFVERCIIMRRQKNK